MRFGTWNVRSLCRSCSLKMENAKLQWLRDPSVVNEDNLGNVRREASRHFRNKKREYLKYKVNELESNTKNKKMRALYWGINNLRRVTNLELMW
jgi:hypothetical protein